MMDPLTGAVCTPPEISQMVDEMLIAQAKWLPQYRHALPSTKRRYRREKKLGTQSSRGAARRKVRSVAQMRKDGDAKRVISSSETVSTRKGT